MSNATRHNLNTNGKSKANAVGQPVLEQLEGRRLMSSVQLVDGMLILEGKANGSNRLTVTPDSNGTTLYARANDARAHYLIRDVKSIRIVGGEKDDLVVIDQAIKQDAYIRTGCGRDSVVGGSGSDTIFGGGDNDTLRGGAGDDLLVGGAGRDRLDAGKNDNPRKVASTASSSNYDVAVTSFTLYDANTNQPIGTLTDRSKLNLAKLPGRLSVVANLSDGSQTGSVSFCYDGVHVRTENLAPFALAADDSGDLRAWNPKAGVHTLSATPFAEKDGNGDAGHHKTITFTVMESKKMSGGGLLSGGGSSNDNTDDKDQNKDDTETDKNNDKPVVDKNAPTPVIEVMDSTVPLGHAIHVNGIKSNLKSGDIINAKFEWDFGDSGSAHNKLTGFNAAHQYSKAGTYTITLKVTNQAGKSSTITTKVTITAPERRYIYVSPKGNDANTGRSKSSAVKSFARAAQLVSDNTEVLFERGGTYTTGSSMNLGHSNILVGAYGSGAQPVIKYNGSETYNTIFITMGGKDVTIQELAFDSTNRSSGDAGYNDAIRVGGQNITVRGNTFRNAGYAVNNNGEPQGVLLQDNTTTSTSSLRAYFAWVQGSDFTIVGNKVHDSVHQHPVRIGGADRVLIAHNDLQNLDTDAGVVKGTITAHVGNHIYITGNTLKHGALGLGPLDGGAGLEIKHKRLRHVVVDSNYIESPVNVGHGTEHVMVRNNVIRQDNGTAIDLPGWSNEYDRGIKDVYIINNTAINNGTGGKFLKVSGPVEQVTVTNNLYVAPNFETGVADAAPIQIRSGDLSGFRLISNNVWPLPTIHTYADGGINFVGPAGDSSSYKTPQEWEDYQQVKNDQYEDVILTDGWRISLGGITAGSSMKKAA